MSNSEQALVEQSEARQFLTFTLGREEYGLDIGNVQELRGYGSVTRIANTSEYIKGVINLRGIIVPILDLRIKLNLSTPVYDQFTVVVVINIHDRLIGVVVDTVSDVIRLTSNQIDNPPDFGDAQQADFVIGLGTIDERMLILIDIEKLLDHRELDLTVSQANQ
jgi:purine-binding chemotaxis protein CheW